MSDSRFSLSTGLAAAAPPRASPRLWGDLFALAGGQLTSKLLGFLAFALLARRLSPQGYGAVEYAAGLAFVAGMFVDAGLSPIGVRRIARHPSRVAETSAEILATRCLLAALSAVALAALARPLSPDPLTARAVVVFAASLLAVPWMQLWLFQAVDRIGWTAVLHTVRMGSFLAFVALSVRGPQHAIRAGFAEIAGLALAGVCALLLQRRYVAPVRLRWNVARLRDLLREAAPIAAANLVSILTCFAPLLLAVKLSGAAQAAPIAAAHRLFFALTTFTWIYHFNLFPVLARAAGPANAELAPLVGASLRLVAWAGAAGAVVLTLLAEPLLAVMFGPPFASAAAALGLLAWALPAMVLADHAGWLLIADGGERAVLAARLAGLAIAYGAGAPLVIAHGPAGGAGALLASTLVVWGVLHVAARRRLGWMPLAPVLPGLAAALATLVAARALGAGPFATVAAAVVALAAAAAPFARTLAADLRRLADAKSRALGEEAPRR